MSVINGRCRPVLMRIFASGDFGHCAELLTLAGLVPSRAEGRSWISERFDVLYSVRLARRNLTSRRHELQES